MFLNVLYKLRQEIIPRAELLKQELSFQEILFLTIGFNFKQLKFI